MNRKIILYRLIAVVLACAVSLSGCKNCHVECTPEEQQWLNEHSKSTPMGFLVIAPPLEFSNEDGSISGITGDMAKLIEKRLGVTFRKIGSVSYPEMLGNIESGKTALLCSAMKLPDREKYAFFTEPYLAIPEVIVAPASETGNLTIADLAGKRVAVVKGLAPQRFLETQNLKGLKLVPVESVSAGLRQLSFGNVDFFVDNIGVVSYFIEEDKITNLRVVGELPFKLQLSICVSKQYPLLYSSIQKALATISASEINAIEKKWIHLNRPFSPAVVGGVVTLLVVLGAIILFQIWCQRRTIKLLKKVKEEVGTQLTSITDHLPSSMMYQLASTRSGHKTFTYVSAGVETLHGVTVESVMKDSSVLFKQFFPEDLQTLATADRNATELFTTFREEVRFNHPTKGPRWSLLSSAPHRMKDGTILWDGIEVDITDRCLAELKMRESKAVLDSLFNGTEDMIWYVDSEEFTVQGFNDKVAAYFREKRGIEMAIGDSMERFFPETGVADKWRDNFRKAIETGSMSFEWKGVASDRIFLLNLFPLELNGKAFAVSTFCKDITEMKLMEQSIRESEERYRLTLNFFPIPITMTNPSGVSIFHNQAFVDQYGYTMEDLPDVSTWINTVYETPEYRDQMVAIWMSDAAEAVATGMMTPVRTHAIIAKDGTPRVLEISMKPIGGNYVNVFVDATERIARESENKKLSEQLHQSQKLEAVGQLAGGIAHDFNNSLGGIIGAAELLKEDSLTDEERCQFIDLILSAADRAGGLTKQLLAFSRKGNKGSTAIDLAKITKETATLLERTINKSITVSIDIQAKQTFVIGDDALLQNALMNIGINASHAMPNGGTLTFKLENTMLDAEYCAVSSFDLIPGEYLEIAIQDTGTGMPPEVLSRIFEPFFTTKEQGKGTGLGMAAVYGTVRDHGGTLSVYSEVGQGTVFYLYFPIEQVSALELPQEEAAARGVGTVLIIDDEELIRITASGMLTNLGYRVICAQNGMEGVEIFSDNYDEIDLVILDMIMPIMGGREAFERIRRIDPTIPVIIASGFAKDEDMIALKSQGVSGFLHKPFRRAELADIVAGVSEKQKVKEL